MGWTRFLLFGDLGQQLDIQEHEARISRLATSNRQRVHEQGARIDELEQHVLELGASVAALVGLLRSKGLATDDEIRRAVDEATTRAEHDLAAKAQVRQDTATAATKQRAARKLDDVRRRRGK